MPGAVPGQQLQPAAAGFVLDIPADPTWEPFEQTDTLDQDGYYAVRITKEAPRSDTSKKAGVFLTLQILDQDAAGRILSKFLGDPRTEKNDIWHQWRGVLRSISGGLDFARQALRYTPGMFANQTAYVKTGAYTSDNGTMRTGVDNWVTKPEYDAAVAASKHRWAAKPKHGTAGGAGAVGALPTGLPGSFPGMGGGPLPGNPMLPMGGSAPMPVAAAPMQQAPQGFPAPQGFAPPAQAAPTQGFAPPQGFAQPPAFGPPPTAQTFAPPPPQQAAPPQPAAPPTFAFPVAPAAVAPATPAAYQFPAPPPPPQAAANGAPQPVGAPTFAFPPAPGA
jgi:hypothetical protein